MRLYSGKVSAISTEVVRSLLAAGESVRALVRKPPGHGDLPAGAEAVVGDLNQPDTLADAFAEVSISTYTIDIQLPILPPVAGDAQR